MLRHEYEAHLMSRFNEHMENNGFSLSNSLEADGQYHLFQTDKGEEAFYVVHKESFPEGDVFVGEYGHLESTQRPYCFNVNVE